MADIGPSHWLLVSDDRQDLERRLRQRLGWRSVQKPFDEWSAVWRGPHWISSPDSSSASPWGGDALRKAHARSTRPVDTRSAAASPARRSDPPATNSTATSPRAPPSA